MSFNTPKVNTDYDLICVGGGIMSATLALIAKLLQPQLNILILERLSKVAQESSAAWNNAGTGHSALCELNYCPENEDGTGVDISNAIEICNQFEMSKQFWAFLVREGLLKDPKNFIHPVKHHSWVEGEENVAYLRKRFHAMKDHFMFDSIEFTTEIDKMKEWFPLIMNHRDESEVMAASRIDRGCEVNFGALTTQLFEILERDFDTPVHCNMEVIDVDPDKGETWFTKVKHLKTKKEFHYDANHVFIGAGGGALLLLQKVEIEEKEGFGGFPVSGQWLVCKNPDVIKQHNAKVYSKAGPGAPPMSTPHLDTRYINNKQELLFGPFAGFSPKFLKEGSHLDLMKSITFDNISPMLGAFWKNLDLTKYLVEQLAMSFDDRMDELRKFIKDAKNEDWKIIHAGQRVQIIKKDAYTGGELQFGTEVISNKSGTITCLLGASPGASTAVHIMMEVLEKAFPEITNSTTGKKKLKHIIPAYNATPTKSSFTKNLKEAKKQLQL